MSTTTTERYELKRADVSTWLWAVVATLGTWQRQWIFFIPNLVINTLGTVAQIGIFYLMARFVAAGAAPFLREYGGRFEAYILLGVVLNGFLSASLSAYYNAYAEGYWANIFEVFVMHPLGISAFMTSSVLFRYLVETFNLFLYLVIGVVVFHVSLGAANYGAFLLILLLATVAVTGLGWMAASTFTLLNSKGWGNPVTWAVTFLTGIVAGVYFPPGVLPRWVRSIGEWLPQTYALHAGRLALLQGAGLNSPAVQADLRRMLVLSAIYLPLGLLLFRASLRKAEREGSLTRWN
jgi:ABC-type multidrug transport system permease subunit